MKKIKVMVVDDHKVLRHGVVDVLKNIEEIEVVCQAGNGKETLKVLEEYSVDVVLLDIQMPEMNGRETLIEIKKLYPNIKVLMFTMHMESWHSKHYLELGADGYLAKNTDVEIIGAKILEVHSKSKSKELNDTVNTIISDEHLRLALSDVENRILILLCESHSNRTISELIGISENTVKYHRKNIYSKTKCNSLIDLMVYALNQGVIKVS
ncbi:MAG: response regulator transcription factor [Bacteroidota bacterium]